MTGDCFVAAYRYLVSVADAEHHRLVHGVVTHSRDGVITHAWVERDSDHMVIDPSNGRLVERHLADYYSALGVADVRTYDASEAVRHNARTGHCGPWDQSLDTAARDLREGREQP